MKLTLEKAKKLMENQNGNLYLSGTQISSLPDNLTVGGGLYLSGTQISSLPDNLTVGGGIDLQGTQISSLPDNLTVGGWLDLHGTQISSLPDNLTVGGGIYLSGTQVKNSKRKKVKTLKQGDYVPGRYLYADGILTHIKKVKKINEYTLFIGKIPGKNVVFDGNNYAHCATLRDGIADIRFKSAKDRGANQYKNMNLDSLIKKEEAITMYRIITGACKQGTEHFVNNLKELKEEYTIREMIDLTKNQYGWEQFKKFFFQNTEERA